MDTETAMSTSHSGRSETLSSLNEALSILKKYNILRDQKAGIEATLEPAVKTEPMEILQPNYEKMPQRPSLPEIPTQKSYAVQMLLVLLAGVLLIAAQTVLLKKGYLLPLEIVRFGFFSINAITFVAVIVVIAGLVTIALAKKKDQKRHDEAVAAYGEVCKKYEASCEEITRLNKTLQDNYEAEVARERQRVDQLNAEAQLEADKKNAEKNLKIKKLEGSMGLLQKKYMEKYSKVIPSKYASIEGIRQIIDIFQQNPEMTAIKEAVDKLS